MSSTSKMGLANVSDSWREPPKSTAVSNRVDLCEPEHSVATMRLGHFIYNFESVRRGMLPITPIHILQARPPGVADVDSSLTA